MKIFSLIEVLGLKLSELSISSSAFFSSLLSVNIPKGVMEGMQLSMSGKGNAGKHNGVPGDLLILVEEEQDKELIRDENDLIYQ